MPETNEQTLEQAKEKQVASIGKVQRVSREESAIGSVEDGALKDKKVEDTAKIIVDTPQEEDIDEEKLKAFFEKQGLKYEGLDKLKEKINYVAPEPEKEQTPEEKEAKAKAEDKQLLDLYIGNGGTAEQFVAMKNILASDLTELSIADIKGEMKLEGFSDEEIAEVLKERYYQINLEEITQGDEETDEDFTKRKEALQKKVTYGAKKLEKRSTHIKKTAESILNGLKEAIKNADLEKQEEAQFQSNVDEHFKSLPRKLTLQLGKSNDIEIAPVDHEVSDESIAKVSALLKDPAKRNQFLFNQDGSINIKNVADIMVKNEELTRIAKGSLLEGQTRQVTEFRKVFPNSAQELGVGGNNHRPNVASKQAVSAGTPTRFKADIRKK